jgi:hypothetical protein
MKNPQAKYWKQLWRYLSVLAIAFPGLALAAAEGASPFATDMSIEGMRSHEFSVAIFYFLIAAIFIFVVFIFLFMFKDKSSKLKKGEKWLFAWLLIGVAVAIAFGATQMLDGYLF